MCGRYALYGPQSRLREQFGVEPFPDWVDRYNIAPTQLAPVIRGGAGAAHELLIARWGLVPGWVKEPGQLAEPIIAKFETAAHKPMFRHAFRNSRVIVPSSGFYEWSATGDHKQPYFIRPSEDAFFGLGGLLERREGPEGVSWSYAILTTAANERMAPIHERMPVILRPSEYAAWLDPGVTDPDLVARLGGPCPSAAMRAYPVGRTVGNPRAQGPGLVDPVDPGEPGGASR